MKTSRSILLATALMLTPWAAGVAAAKDIHSAESPVTSLTTAVATALATHAGIPVAAKLEHHEDEAVYEIAIATSKGIATVFIDPATGHIVETDQQNLFDRVFGDDDAEHAVASKADLLGALAAVERTTHSPVREAVLRTEHGAPRYIVRTAESVVAINAVSGAPAQLRDGDLHDLGEDID